MGIAMPEISSFRPQWAVRRRIPARPENLHQLQPLSHPQILSRPQNRFPSTDAVDGRNSDT
jgi:hypothetical protein